jgi:cellulose synthase/poly-beta-1,6-N-acetylglucosamine synthase-like glycosyltransferase
MDLLEEKDEFYSKYDLFITLDADNFIDPDFLKHMNSQYLSYKPNKRPVMIQAYLDSKNKENLVSRGYYVAYRYMNGFFQLAKHKLGLTPGIGGTGFAISLPFLQSIGGYNCRSLVEDLEFETIATMHGKSIAYNHNVRVYDEKPTSFKAATIQKTRWCQGHWWVFFRYAPKLLLHMLNPLEIKYFFKRLDNLVHLCALLFMSLGLLVVLSPLVALALGVEMPQSILVTISGILFMCSLILIPISSLLDGKEEEKKRVLIDLIPNLLSMVVQAVSYYYANIVGFFRCGNQKVWVKTKHKVTAITYSAGIQSPAVTTSAETAETAVDAEAEAKTESKEEVNV